MDNLQSKIQKGISSVQKGIEGGKSKIQTSQEVIGLKDKVRENQEKRTSLILSLGELTYEKLRNNHIQDEAIIPIGEKLLELDREIYNLLQIIEEKTKEEGPLACECGNTLSPQDNFCKICGKKVEVFTTEEEVKILCPRCQVEISAVSKYCNCCGIKLN